MAGSCARGGQYCLSPDTLNSVVNVLSINEHSIYAIQVEVNLRRVTISYNRSQKQPFQSQNGYTWVARGVFAQVPGCGIIGDMATVIETVERDGVLVNVYDTGMERRADNGHFVRPPASALITEQNSNEFLRKRLEKKRARAVAGANAALAKLRDAEGEPIWDAPVDDDYIEAIVEAQTDLALTGNAYSTRAADFVMEQTGNKEAVRAQETPIQQATAFLEALPAIVQLMRAAIQPAEVQIHATIDADVSDG